jgi:hypothetical protein
MAKKMTLLGALFAALLLSAGCDSDSKGDENVAGDTASDPTGDTASDAPGDTASDAPGDTASDDPGDTASDDPGDTEIDDPVDTATDDPGDTATDDPGDTASDDPGDTASDAPGDTASDDPGDTDTGTDPDPDPETPPLVCDSDADCTEPGLGICLVATGECVACIDDEDCPSSDVCNDNTCEASEWTCDDSWYGDGECDCGCGALDIDCDGPYAADCDWTFQCTNQWLVVDPNQNWRCIDPPPAPDEWDCDPSWYGDDFCDCGCGVIDYDCDGPYAADCDWTFKCTDQGLVVDPNENWRCLDLPPPAEWDCNPSWYGDGACHCGCGALDYDCAGPEASHCYHTAACTNQWLAVHPDENWRCIDPSVPLEWTCNPYDYDDYFCDCGCGVLDIDCAGPEATRCHVLSACTDQGLVVDPNQNWLCIDP